MKEELNGKLALRHAHFKVTQRTFHAHLMRSLPFSKEELNGKLHMSS